jgi:hypothetical protein
LPACGHALPTLGCLFPSQLANWPLSNPGRDSGSDAESIEFGSEAG